MKFHAARQVISDLEKAKKAYGEHVALVADNESKMRDAGKAVADAEEAIEARKISIRNILSDIESLNHKITDLHGQKRALESEIVHIHEDVRSRLDAAARIKNEAAQVIRQGAALSGRIESLEKKVPIAQARIQKVEARRKAAAQTEERVVKVVHVTLEGKPLNHPVLDEQFVMRGDRLVRKVRIARGAPQK